MNIIKGYYYSYGDELFNGFFANEEAFQKYRKNLETQNKIPNRDMPKLDILRTIQIRQGWVKEIITVIE